MGYKDDKKWEESCHAQVFKILKPYLIDFIVMSVATDEQDKKYATDFTIEFVGGTIACRIRRGEECHWRQLTLRTRRLENRNIEFRKIINGYAKIYFYAWTENNVIVEWIIVDLDKLRASGLLQKRRREIENKDKDRKPDGTYFIAIDLKELRDTGCLIAEHVIEKSVQRKVNTNASMREGLKRVMSATYKAGNYTSRSDELIHPSDEEIAVLIESCCQPHQYWQE